jgi:hypothetical protein
MTQTSASGFCTSTVVLMVSLVGKVMCSASLRVLCAFPLMSTKTNSWARRMNETTKSGEEDVQACLAEFSTVAWQPWKPLRVSHGQSSTSIIQHLGIATCVERALKAQRSPIPGRSPPAPAIDTHRGPSRLLRDSTLQTMAGTENWNQVRHIQYY